MHLQDITINGMDLAQLTEKLNRGETIAVGASDLIGTMGNTGVQDQHVHYQMKDANDNPIDPELYHDKGGNGDTTDCLYPPEDIFGGIPILEQSVLDFETAESTSPAPVRLTGSPIILDLDGDGIETIGVNAGAYFDHGGDGFAEQTGWVGADDGLLVWDRNSDGRINDGKELFGSETLLSDGTKAANGYAALAELGCRKWGHSAFLEPLTANDEEKSRMSPFLLSETNPGDRSALLDQILFKWTGVDAVDPTSRGSFFDARKLVVMEKFYGRNAYDAKCNVYASSTALA